MAELKRNFLKGRMNKDLDERLIPNGEYRDALNIEIVTSEGSDTGSVQNKKGNKNVVKGGKNSNISDLSSSAITVGSYSDYYNNTIYNFIHKAQELVDDGSYVTGIRKTGIKSDIITVGSTVNNSEDINTTVLVCDVHEVRQVADAQADDTQLTGLPVLTKAVDDYTIRWTPIRKGMKVGLVTPDGNDYWANLDVVVTGTQVVFNPINNTYTAKVNITTVDSVYYYNNGFINSGAVLRFYSDKVLNFTSGTFETETNGTNSVSHTPSNCIITGINIVDDILYYTDGRNEPKRIDINLFLSRSENLINKHSKFVQPGQEDIQNLKLSHISVLRPNPLMPPTVIGVSTSRVVEPIPGTDGINYSSQIVGNLREFEAPWNDGEVPFNFRLSTDGNAFNETQSNRRTTWYVNCSTEFVNWRNNDILQITGTVSAKTARIQIIDTFGTPNSTFANFQVKLIDVDPDYTGAEAAESWNAVLVEKETIYPKKFICFAYRYKYLNDEYSCISPYSKPVFIPGFYAFSAADGNNKGMENRLKQVIVKNFVSRNTPNDVASVEILFKDTNNPNIYSIKTIDKNSSDWNAVTEGSYSGKISIDSEIFGRTLPEVQGVRVFDNVPKSAIAQEFSGNRLMYGNYVENYNLINSSTEKVIPKIQTNVLSIDALEAKSETIENTFIAASVNPSEGWFTDGIIANTANNVLWNGNLVLDAFSTDMYPLVDDSSYTSNDPDWFRIINTPLPLNGEAFDEGNNFLPILPSIDLDVVEENGNNTLTVIGPNNPEIVAEVVGSKGAFFQAPHSGVFRFKGSVDIRLRESNIITNEAKYAFNLCLVKTNANGNPLVVPTFYTDDNGTTQVSSFSEGIIRKGPNNFLNTTLVSAYDKPDFTTLTLGDSAEDTVSVYLNEGECVTLFIPYPVGEVRKKASTALGGNATVAGANVNSVNGFYYGGHIRNANFACTTAANVTNFIGSIKPGQPSVKSLRTYQVGIVYLDGLGRESTVLLDDDLYSVPLEKSDKVNKITVIAKHRAPYWAKYYKYFIKEIAPEYHNIVLYKAYANDSHTNVDDEIGQPSDGSAAMAWLAFNSVDRNKLSIDDYLVLKKTHGQVSDDALSANQASLTGANKNKEARFRILDIADSSNNISEDNPNASQLPDIVQSVIEESTNPNDINGKFFVKVRADINFDLLIGDSDSMSDDEKVAGGACFEVEGTKTIDLDLFYEASQAFPIKLTEDDAEMYIKPGAKLDIFTDNPQLISALTSAISAIESIIQSALDSVAATTFSELEDALGADSGIFVNASAAQVDLDNHLAVLDYEPTVINVNGAKSFSTYYFENQNSTDGLCAVYLSSEVPNLLGTLAASYTSPIEVRFVNPDGSYVKAKLIRNLESNVAYILPITHPTFSSSSIFHNQICLPWFNCFTFGNGVESDRIRDDFNANVIYPFTETGKTSGFKASLPDPDYKEERKAHDIIFSQIKNEATGTNRTNEFILAEPIVKRLNNEYGSIQKLYTRNSDLLAFCEEKVLKILANKDALFNADGNSQLLSSTNVLGQSVPFVGDYGISKNPESFSADEFRIYFTDKDRGAVLRLSRDGITAVSDAGMKDFFSDNLKNATALIGGYDGRKDEYNLTIHSVNSPNDAKEVYTVSYSEKVKGWTSFKSFIPESSATLNNNYYTFKNGKLYLHETEDTSIAYNNFYGTQYTSTITPVFNDSSDVVKSYKYVAYEGTQAKIIEFDDVVSDGVTYNDGQYYNIDAKKGWELTSIVTDLQDGTIDEFVEKEGKWFNYIKGVATTFTNAADAGSVSTNLDFSEFSVQGIGQLVSVNTTDDFVSQGFNVVLSLNLPEGVEVLNGTASEAFSLYNQTSYPTTATFTLTSSNSSTGLSASLFPTSAQITEVGSSSSYTAGDEGEFISSVVFIDSTDSPGTAGNNVNVTVFFDSTGHTGNELHSIDLSTAVVTNNVVIYTAQILENVNANFNNHASAYVLGSDQLIDGYASNEELGAFIADPSSSNYLQGSNFSFDGSIYQNYNISTTVGFGNDYGSGIFLFYVTVQSDPGWYFPPGETPNLEFLDDSELENYTITKTEFSNPSIDSIGIENVDSIQYMVQYNGSLNTESTLVDDNNIFLLQATNNLISTQLYYNTDQEIFFAQSQDQTEISVPVFNNTGEFTINVYDVTGVADGNEFTVDSITLGITPDYVTAIADSGYNSVAINIDDNDQNIIRKVRIDIVGPLNDANNPSDSILVKQNNFVEPVLENEGIKFQPFVTFNESFSEGYVVAPNADYSQLYKNLIGPGGENYTSDTDGLRVDDNPNYFQNYRVQVTTEYDELYLPDLAEDIQGVEPTVSVEYFTYDIATNQATPDIPYNDGSWVIADTGIGATGPNSVIEPGDSVTMINTMLEEDVPFNEFHIDLNFAKNETNKVRKAVLTITHGIELGLTKQITILQENTYNPNVNTVTFKSPTLEIDGTVIPSADRGDYFVINWDTTQFNLHTRIPYGDQIPSTNEQLYNISGGYQIVDDYPQLIPNTAPKFNTRAYIGNLSQNGYDFDVSQESAVELPNFVDNFQGQQDVTIHSDVGNGGPQHKLTLTMLYGDQVFESAAQSEYGGAQYVLSSDQSSLDGIGYLKMNASSREFPVFARSPEQSTNTTSPFNVDDIITVHQLPLPYASWFPENKLYLQKQYAGIEGGNIITGDGSSSGNNVFNHEFGSAFGNSGFAGLKLVAYSNLYAETNPDFANSPGFENKPQRYKGDGENNTNISPQPVVKLLRYIQYAPNIVEAAPAVNFDEVEGFDSVGELDESQLLPTSYFPTANDAYPSWLGDITVHPTGGEGSCFVNIPFELNFTGYPREFHLGLFAYDNNDSVITNTYQNFDVNQRVIDFYNNTVMGSDIETNQYNIEQKYGGSFLRIVQNPTLPVLQFEGYSSLPVNNTAQTSKIFTGIFGYTEDDTDQSDLIWSGGSVDGSNVENPFSGPHAENYYVSEAAYDADAGILFEYEPTNFVTAYTCVGIASSGASVGFVQGGNNKIKIRHNVNTVDLTSGLAQKPNIENLFWTSDIDSAGDPWYRANSLAPLTFFTNNGSSITSPSQLQLHYPSSDGSAENEDPSSPFVYLKYVSSENTTGKTRAVRILFNNHYDNSKKFWLEIRQQSSVPVADPDLEGGGLI